MVMLADARIPVGLRIYAIGDVHGCTGLLAEMYARIARDLDRRPAEDWRVIHIGDFIDRGPDSLGTLKLLLDYREGGHADFLLGNHDQFLRDFLARPDGEDFELWMYNGGVATLASFGFDGFAMAYSSGAESLAELRDAILAAMPPEMPEFLAGLLLMRRYGDYAFVHAGIHPGAPLEDQSDHDLVWIREHFLYSNADHGAVIVHGHTPVTEVDVRQNRIGIDTGAVFAGRLSCLVLEDAEQMLLEADGPVPLPAPIVSR